MTYPTWQDHPSELSPSSCSGSGGSHGDLRERVRALEVSRHHSDRYMHDRIQAHHDRLLVGDEKMGRLSRDAIETKRQVLTNSENIAKIRTSHEDLHRQVAEMKSVAAANVMAKDHRREARAEVLKLIGWALFAILVMATVTGHIPEERLKALQHLKILLGL